MSRLASTQAAPAEPGPAEPRGAGAPARTRRAVPLGAMVAAIVVAQVAAWLAIVHDGFFRVDDYLYLANVQRMGGWDIDWLGSVWFKHFAPLDRVTWTLVGHATPTSWAALLAFQLGMLATGMLAFYGSLRLLFGRSLWLLVPVAVVGITPQLAMAFAWPSHGLMALPEFAAQTLTLYGFLSYVATRRRRFLFLCTLALVFGLLFYVRTLLVLVVIAVVYLLWLQPSLRPAALRQALRRDWPVWCAVLVPALAYVVYYASRDVFGESTPYTFTALELYVRILWLRNIWPRMLGVVFGSEPLSTAKVMVEILAQLLLWGAVAFTLWRKRAAWRGWILIPAVLVPTIWMSAAGRLAELGALMGADFRYATHLPWMFSLAVLFAFHPRARLTLGADWPPRTGAARRPRAAHALAGALAVAVVLIAASSVREVHRTAAQWNGDGARAYVANLMETARSFDARGETAHIADGPAPKVLQGDFPLTVTEIVVATGAPVVVSAAEIPAVSLMEDGRLSRGRYVPYREIPIDRAAARDRLTSGGKWTQVPGGWCLEPAAGVEKAAFEVPVRPSTPAGEAVLDAQLLGPTYLPVAFDTGDGMSQYAAKALWGDRARRVGMMTGVNRLAGFRIDVPKDQKLCVSRLSVGVYHPPAA